MNILLAGRVTLANPCKRIDDVEGAAAEQLAHVNSGIENMTSLNRRTGKMSEPEVHQRRQGWMRGPQTRRLYIHSSCCGCVLHLIYGNGGFATFVAVPSSSLF